MWMGAGQSGKQTKRIGREYSVKTGQNGETKEPKQTQMGRKKRIGIKYCGGCNPGYERVEMMERIQLRFNDRFLFLRHDEPDIDVLILMSGCPRACAAEDLNTTKIPNCLVTGEDDFDSLIDWLKSLDRKGDF